MENKLVKIAEFNDYIEADLAKQRLEDFGIKAVVVGANASNTYGSIMAVEGPALLVVEEQADEARRILEEEVEVEEAEDDQEQTGEN